jgi:hypothetical protein
VLHTHGTAAISAAVRLVYGWQLWERGERQASRMSPLVEIEQAILAVRRVRTESELRELWAQDVDGPANAWLRHVDDLIARLGQSGAGDPCSSFRSAHDRDGAGHKGVELAIELVGAGLGELEMSRLTRLERSGVECS